ncbi:hypothetical protein BpHYR1_032878 [Brachionus plicatilis]|uniref:Uncharacterized protein n=1 Tax=Brachionus plicatilis TaxID=10195 RepID=A0A3M7P7R9_BRAPC|nr:hypothetical protein BpHYR1_032878 [Brachionus plicatilis]
MIVFSCVFVYFLPKKSDLEKLFNEAKILIQLNLIDLCIIRLLILILTKNCDIMLKKYNAGSIFYFNFKLLLLYMVLTMICVISGKLTLSYTQDLMHGRFEIGQIIHAFNTKIKESLYFNYLIQIK